MRTIIDPRQNELFDTYHSMLSPVAYKRLVSGWQGVFRHVILQEMPVEELGKNFSPDQGRPSSELYSMAGLMLIMEFKNWTVEEAADAYMYNADIQYALNLGRDKQSMTTRTIERFQRLFREQKLASKVMDRVSMSLVEELELDVKKQRLDSTHVFSNMATFTRTRMLGVVIKRFLVQLKRHHTGAYEGLSEELRQRYGQSEGHLFGDVSRDENTRKLLKQQVAEDLYELIELFASDNKISNRTSYKNMVTVFGQQCEVKDGKVAVKKKPGGQIMLNPSDPDATYDGHKGAGYQVQLSETCSEENEIQLITCAIPEQAHEHDSNAVSKVIADLENKEMLPEELIADTHYGSDENFQECKKKKMVLISPVAGPKPKEGPHTPTKKQQHLQARRIEQETDEWKQRYRIRSGIEGTNSGIKRKTGLGKLRVRGAASVDHCILMRIAGWNIMRAACSKKMKEKIRKLARKGLSGGLIRSLYGLFTLPAAWRKALYSIYAPSTKWIFA